MRNINNTYEDWGATTEVDTEKREFIIRVPFAPEELPYYPVMITSTIALRSPTTMYHHLARGSFGLAGVRLDGQAHITHESLLGYLEARGASTQGRMQRKMAKVMQQIIPTVHPKRQQKEADDPTPAAEAIVESGTLDFLDELFGSDGDE